MKFIIIFNLFVLCMCQDSTHDWYNSLWLLSSSMLFLLFFCIIFLTLYNFFLQNDHDDDVEFLIRHPNEINF